MVLDEPPQHILITSVHRGFEDVDHMINWCVENCEGEFTHAYYSWESHAWYFELASDHMHFALRWC